MSTPNPLIPQGTFQAQANKGASNVRIAVATIVAIHVVFFGGLLLQGCKRDTKTAGANSETNAPAGGLSLPPLETAYYSNANHLPTENTAPLFTSAPPAAVESSASNTASTIRDTLAPSSNLGAVPTSPETATGPSKEYTIARGDTFARIAAANGTTVNALRKANPTVDPAKIRPGMKVQVPAATGAPSSAHSATTPITHEVSGSSGPAGSYVVKPGDTLTKVAKANGITVSQLRAANNLKTSGLKVGQKIKIPAPSAGTNATHKTGNTKAPAASSLN